MKTLVIARREARAYLASPGAYIIIAVFAAITGYLFVDGVSVPFPEATVHRYAGAVIFSLVFLGPALTMRLLAEERRLGTLDLLLSSPVSDWQVVAGKYLGAMALYVLMLLATLFYAALLYWLGTPDSGPVATAYLGLFLYGAATLAVGLWASSLTANQAVAAVVGVGVLVLLSITQAGRGLDRRMGVNAIGGDLHGDAFRRSAARSLGPLRHRLLPQRHSAVSVSLGAVNREQAVGVTRAMSGE